MYRAGWMAVKSRDSSCFLVPAHPTARAFTTASGPAKWAIRIPIKWCPKRMFKYPHLKSRGPRTNSKAHRSSSASLPAVPNPQVPMPATSAMWPASSKPRNAPCTSVSPWWFRSKSSTAPTTSMYGSTTSPRPRDSGKRMWRFPNPAGSLRLLPVSATTSPLSANWFCSRNKPVP